MNRPLTRKLLPWRVLYWASILLFTAAASHWIGWLTAFLGMEAGLSTSWGERLFVFSNHILLSTNYYRVYAVIKQIAKILLYLKFGHLLFQSLTQPDKSFADILQEFVNKFFEVNAKSLWEFFVSMFK